MKKAYQCQICGHVCDSSYVCYRCRRNNQILHSSPRDTTQLEKLKWLIKIEHGSLKNLFESIAENCICDENCPISDFCPQNVHPSMSKTQSFNYCKNQLLKWWKK